MTTFVVENDRVLRTFEVALDPCLAPERLAAVSDYFAHDGIDVAAWRAGLQHRIGGILPVALRFVGTRDELRAALPGAAAVVVESLEIADAELEAGAALAMVCKFGRITDNIDLEACARRGVRTHAVRRRTNIAVAEFALACMLEFARNIVALNGRVTVERIGTAEAPYRPYDTRYVGMNNYARAGGARNLADSTVGIFGMGETGRELAALARAFGAKVVYSQRRRLDPALEAGLGVAYRKPRALFSEADFVSLHLPLTAQTRGLVGRELLGAMKPGAFLVNTARAAVIGREALIEALESGRLGGAALDVHYEEPVPADDALLAFPNVLLTPHVAGGSRRNIIGDIEEIVLQAHDAMVAGRCNPA